MAARRDRDRLADRPLLVPADPPAYEPCRLVPGVFTPRQCDRVIELAESLPQERGTVEGDDGGTEDAALRRSSITWVPPDEEHRWIFDRLARVAERANRHYGFELTGFGEDLQYTRYDTPGAFYTWHQDGLDGPVGLRKLSIVVQLTDPADYEGGELELFGLADDADPTWRAASERRGTAVVFPSFEYHRVRPLRRGVRRSLVSWVSGPPFR